MLAWFPILESLGLLQNCFLLEINEDRHSEMTPNSNKKRAEKQEFYND